MLRRKTKYAQDDNKSSENDGSDREETQKIHKKFSEIPETISCISVEKPVLKPEITIPKDVKKLGAKIITAKSRQSIIRGIRTKEELLSNNTVKNDKKEERRVEEKDVSSINNTTHAQTETQKSISPKIMPEDNTNLKVVKKSNSNENLSSQIKIEEFFSQKIENNDVKTQKENEKNPDNKQNLEDEFIERAQILENIEMACVNDANKKTEISNPNTVINDEMDTKKVSLTSKNKQESFPVVFTEHEKTETENKNKSKTPNPKPDACQISVFKSNVQNQNEITVEISSNIQNKTSEAQTNNEINYNQQKDNNKIDLNIEEIIKDEIIEEKRKSTFMHDYINDEKYEVSFYKNEDLKVTQNVQENENKIKQEDLILSTDNACANTITTEKTKIEEIQEVQMNNEQETIKKNYENMVNEFEKIDISTSQNNAQAQQPYQKSEHHPYQNYQPDPYLIQQSMNQNSSRSMSQNFGHAQINNQIGNPQMDPYSQMGYSGMGFSNLGYAQPYYHSNFIPYQYVNHYIPPPMYTHPAVRYSSVYGQTPHAYDPHIIPPVPAMLTKPPDPAMQAYQEWQAGYTKWYEAFVNSRNTTQIGRRDSVDTKSIHGGSLGFDHIRRHERDNLSAYGDAFSKNDPKSYETTPNLKNFSSIDERRNPNIHYNHLKNITSRNRNFPNDKFGNIDLKNIDSKDLDVKDLIGQNTENENRLTPYLHSNDHLCSRISHNLWSVLLHDEIHLYSLEIEELDLEFPGPLTTKNDVTTRKLSKYMQKKLEESVIELDSLQLLWRVLLHVVKSKGKFDFGELAEILIEHNKKLTITQHVNSHEIKCSGTFHSSLVSALLNDDLQQGLEHVLGAGNWGLLFALSVSDEKTRAETLKKYIDSLDHHDLLRSYISLKNEIPIDISLIKDFELVKNWSQHVALFISQFPAHTEACRTYVFNIAKILQSKGRWNEYQVCLIILDLIMGAENVDVPTFYPEVGLSRQSLELTKNDILLLRTLEIYEYLKTLENPSFNYPYAQIFKFSYCEMLSFTKNKNQCFEYLQAISRVVLLDPYSYSHNFVHRLIKLSRSLFYQCFHSVKFPDWLIKLNDHISVLFEPSKSQDHSADTLTSEIPKSIQTIEEPSVKPLRMKSETSLFETFPENVFTTQDISDVKNIKYESKEAENGEDFTPVPFHKVPSLSRPQFPSIPQPFNLQSISAQNSPTQPFIDPSPIINSEINFQKLEQIMPKTPSFTIPPEIPAKNNSPKPIPGSSENQPTVSVNSSQGDKSKTCEKSFEAKDSQQPSKSLIKGASSILGKIFRPREQIFLPDDTEQNIVFDSNTNRYVDKSNPDGDKDAPISAPPMSIQSLESKNPPKPGNSGRPLNRYVSPKY